MPTARGNVTILPGSTARGVNAEALGGDARGAAPAARRRAGRPRLLANPTVALEVTVPLRVVNPLNARGSTRERIGRPKRERNAIQAVLFGVAHKVAPHWLMRGPYRVTLTKLGGRRMDSDGLQAAMKTVRDTVCMWLCGGLPGQFDDDWRQVSWDYAQEPGGEVGARIRVEAQR